MFSPRVLERLADEKVDSIASEDLSTKVERERLEEKLAKLQSSLKKLHRLDRNSLSGRNLAYIKWKDSILIKL